MVPPSGLAAARSGSTWIHWWSPVASAKALTRSWVTSCQSGGPSSLPISAVSSSKLAGRTGSAVVSVICLPRFRVVQGLDVSRWLHRKSCVADPRHLNLTTDSTIQKRDASHNARRRRGHLVKVAQKVAIVTGGGGGIGGAIADRLAEQGAKVLVADL